LQLFVQQATQRGLADRSKFKSKQSRQALQTFIELNLFILNIKKVCNYLSFDDVISSSTDITLPIVF
jgi:hypothetical protein